VKVNVNCLARAVLTERGAELYNQHGSREFESFPVRDRKRAGEVLEEQLWVLMLIFGPHLSLGNAPPFEANVITFVQYEVWSSEGLEGSFLDRHHADGYLRGLREIGARQLEVRERRET
jgi:hypothetical protein